MPQQKKTTKKKAATLPTKGAAASLARSMVAKGVPKQRAAAVAKKMSRHVKGK